MKAIALVVFMLTTGLNATDRDWKKDRAVSGFTGLNVSSGIDVYLTQGNSEKLTFDAEYESLRRFGHLLLRISQSAGK